MHPNLSFEQAPAISVPFRFLLTAPWFGVAAGLLLAVTGDAAVATRWSPAALALTHLVAVGFMLHAMTGALLQFVPVAAGGNVWRPRLVAGIVHPVLLLAAFGLAAGLLTGAGGLLRLAAGLLVTSIGLLVVVIGAALLRTPAQGATLRALRLAVAGLLVTGIFGSVLAEGLAGGHPWPLAATADVHAAWGLGGWALLLLAGVSYLVVPMFQLTPQYPQGFAKWLPIALSIALAGWSAQLLGADRMVSGLAGVLGVVLAAAYGAITLRLQARRRRRVADPTFWFFRLSMAALLAIPLSAAVAGLVPELGEHPRAAWWFGVLTLVGVFVSAINGMAYKIVPFLNWLHLQRLLGLGAMPPNIKDMIPERAMAGQLRLHAAALVALLAATFWPTLLAAPSGLLFAGSCAWLGGNLIRALRVYLGVRDRIGAGGAGSAP